MFKMIKVTIEKKKTKKDQNKKINNAYYDGYNITVLVYRIYYAGYIVTVVESYFQKKKTQEYYDDSYLAVLV